MNRSTNHPSCPTKPNNQRVVDYWSYMVIRPTSNSFKSPGVEYTLTYFDNPGIVLPSKITSWVAHKQMPDFLNKLYLATLEYAMTRKFEDAEVNKVDTTAVQFQIRLDRNFISDFRFVSVFILAAGECKRLYTRSRLRVSTRARNKMALFQKRRK